ncbi:MAG: hypothetical protein RLZZ427_1118 [Pseudomonadota bacterium]
MKRAIVIPAAAQAAALSQLKDWLGLTTTAEDPALAALLLAAFDLCEDFTGVMPLQQGCEEILPVTSEWSVLNTRPVQAITAVQGLPAEGARFTLPVADYAIDLGADGTGRVRIRNPGSAGRIAVRFTAGLASDWSGLPDALRHGVLRLAAHQYRTREDGAAAPLPPAAIAAMWRPWRQLRLA